MIGTLHQIGLLLALSYQGFEVRNQRDIIWEWDPAKDREKRWALVNAVMNLRVSQKKTVDFSANICPTRTDDGY